MPRGNKRREERFIKEYLIDLNGTQAAIRAGYRATSARTLAAKLLAKGNVRSKIDCLIAERSKRTGVTADRVIREMARIAFCDSRKLMEWGPGGVTLRESSELSEDDAACVAEACQTITKEGGSIRIKLHDKQRAIEQLAKHLGLTPERLEMAGDLDVTMHEDYEGSEAMEILEHLARANVVELRKPPERNGDSDDFELGNGNGNGHA